MTHFPRVYRASEVARNSFIVLGGALCAAGLAALIGAFVVLDDEFLRPVLFVGVPVLGALGVLIILATIRSRVVLFADRIEVHETFASKQLDRSEIIGRRWITVRRGQRILELVSDSRHAKSLKIPESTPIDSEFESWLAGITDVDAREAQASLDAYLNDPSVPGSDAEKKERLERAKFIGKICYGVTIAVCIWGLAYPHPYSFAMLALVILPWVAIGLAATGGGTYRLHLGRNQIGADLSPMLIGPALVLAANAFLRIHVLDWQRLILYTLVGAALGTALVALWVADVRARRAVLITVAVSMTAFAYGAVVHGNRDFDSSQSTTYRVQVEGEHYSTGKSTTYYLHLSAWGPRQQSQDVDVDRSFYRRVSVGDTVCVFQRRGFLQIAWFEVGICPTG